MENTDLFNGNSIDQTDTLVEHHLANMAEDNADLVPDDLLIRMDSILAKNAISFKRSFPFNGDLILDISYFIAHKYQQTGSESCLVLPERFVHQLNVNQPEIAEFFDAQGKGNANPNIKFLFDPVEFAETMGYSRNHLRKRTVFPGYLIKHFGKQIMVPLNTIEALTSMKDMSYVINTLDKISGFDTGVAKSYKSFKSLSQLKTALSLQVVDHFYKIYPGQAHFDSIMDDAIWRAANEKLSLSYTGSLKNYAYAVTQGVDLLNKAIRFEDHTNYKKVYYAFYINKNFLENLAACFCISSPRIIPSLRKERTRIIAEYILASRYAAYKNNNRFELNFSLCKELCEVDLKLPDPYEKGTRASLIRRQVKLRITNKINKALVTLSKIGVDAELVWEKGQGHRWEYNPVLVFSVSRKLKQVEYQMKTKRSAGELKNRLFIAYLRSKNLPNNSFLIIFVIIEFAMKNATPCPGIQGHFPGCSCIAPHQ